MKKYTTVFTQERHDLLTTILETGRYEIVKEGDTVQVWSNVRKQRKQLVLCENNVGYLYVAFRYQGNRYVFLHHQLVAYAHGLNFVDRQLNHMDGNKQNNVITNLEAVTPAENIHHAMETGLMKHAKLNRPQVLLLRALHDTGDWNQRELAERFGIDRSTVGYIVRGEVWKSIK